MEVQKEKNHGNVVLSNGEEENIVATGSDQVAQAKEVEYDIGICKLEHQGENDDTDQTKQLVNTDEMDPTIVHKAFIQSEIKHFQEEFPEVDLSVLMNDDVFRRFCGSRFGREPISDLYRDYCDILGQAECAAVARAESNKPLSDGFASRLTAQERWMLNDWNSTYPEMKMTESEFFSRGVKQQIRR